MTAVAKSISVPRFFEADDYPTICKWWKAWGFPQVDLDVLPTTGFIADGCAAVFLYLTNSSVAWMEFLVSDPEVDEDIRSAAVDKVIEHAIFQARRSDARVFFTTSNRDAVSKRLEQHGFVRDIDTTQFFRRL